MSRPPVKLTPQQVEDAFAAHGTIRAAAEALGMTYRALDKRLGRSRSLAEAARVGRATHKAGGRVEQPLSARAARALALAGRTVARRGNSEHASTPVRVDVEAVAAWNRRQQLTRETYFREQRP